MDKYNRQIILNNFGKQGQKKLLKSKVGIIGLGSLGGIAAEYLARAGSNLVLIDRDVVERNNLHRQFFLEEDVNKPKAFVMKERLKRANPEIGINAFCEEINRDTLDLIEDVDIILDGTDNLYTRFLLNEFCIKNKIPMVYGGIVERRGTVAFVGPDGPCLNCLLSEPKSYETCETVGVLGPVAGLTGSIQAGMVLEYLTGKGFTGVFLEIDFDELKFNKLKFNKRRNCPVCSEKKFNQKTFRNQENIETLCGDSVQIFPDKGKSLDLKNLKYNLEKSGFEIKYSNENMINLNYGKHGVVIFKNGRVLVKNTKSRKRARSIRDKLVPV